MRGEVSAPMEIFLHARRNVDYLASGVNEMFVCVIATTSEDPPSLGDLRTVRQYTI